MEIADAALHAAEGQEGSRWQMCSFPDSLTDRGRFFEDIECVERGQIASDTPGFHRMNTAFRYSSGRPEGQALYSG